MKISSGPLQGYTDDIFRWVHHEIFGGIDEYFGPYIRLEAHKEPKSSQIRDIESAYNHQMNYTPQILSKDARLIIQQIGKLQQLGFGKINWNLGCPYPMVTKRGMGSGLLNQAELVREILDQIYSETSVRLSIKCRLGVDTDRDIYRLIDLFNDFDLSEIIIHARTAKQMYKGQAKPEKVLPLIHKSKHPITYNGDIHTIEDFIRITEIFEGQIHHFMLGRGLLANPALARHIKGIRIEKNSFSEFHDLLIEKYFHRYQEHQLLKKMQAFWEYFGLEFPEERKVLKQIKKANKWDTYLEASQHIISTYNNQ
jgi:tRNA-dihydrouridine synthase